MPSPDAARQDDPRQDSLGQDGPQEPPRGPYDESPQELYLDPEVLAQELAEELLGDPLDDLDTTEPAPAAVAAECDHGLALLRQAAERAGCERVGGELAAGERAACGRSGSDAGSGGAGSSEVSTQDLHMQGLRIFCEHRDPRAVPLLLPLLEASCPILRMSAVYALGRNPSPLAVQPLLALLAGDDNGYVRKAVAWSLGNYPEAPVLNPLIRALQVDIAAVRLWAASSLADAGATGAAKADPAAAQLLLSLGIDSEPAVRSNSAWALGRLYPDLVEPRQREVVEALVHALLEDSDSAVRDEARLALEQLEQPEVLERLQTLVEEGLLV